MQYLLILIFLCVHSHYGNEIGYSYGSPTYTHFTYIFQHADLVHLSLNSIAFIKMYNTLTQFIRKRIILITSFLSGFLASFLAIYDTPTVGSSSLVYAMVGIYIGITLFSFKVKIVDKKKYSIFLLSILLFLSVSYFKSNSNFLVHLFSLIISFLFTSFNLYFNSK